MVEFENSEQEREFAATIFAEPLEMKSLWWPLWGASGTLEFEATLTHLGRCAQFVEQKIPPGSAREATQINRPCVPGECEN